MVLSGLRVRLSIGLCISVPHHRANDLGRASRPVSLLRRPLGVFMLRAARHGHGGLSSWPSPTAPAVASSATWLPSITSRSSGTARARAISQISSEFSTTPVLRPPSRPPSRPHPKPQLCPSATAALSGNRPSTNDSSPLPHLLRAPLADKIQPTLHATAARQRQAGGLGSPGLAPRFPGHAPRGGSVHAGADGNDHQAHGERPAGAGRRLPSARCLRERCGASGAGGPVPLRRVREQAPL